MAHRIHSLLVTPYPALLTVGWVKRAKDPAWGSQAGELWNDSLSWNLEWPASEDPRGPRLAPPTLQLGEKCGLGAPEEGCMLSPLAQRDGEYTEFRRCNQ